MGFLSDVGDFVTGGLVNTSGGSRIVDRLTGKESANAAREGGQQLSTAVLEGAGLREAGILQGLSAQERFGREGLDILQSNLDPFTNAFGAEDIEGLRRLATDPNQQLDFLTNNPLFDALRSQARESTFRTQGSRGGLGGSGTDEILQNQFLSLGNSLIDQQINRQLPIFGAAQNAATTIGTGGANILQNIGATQFRGRAGIGEAQAGGVEGSAQALVTGDIGAANARAQGTQNLLSAGTTIASLFSDERLKTDIEKIGSLSGINVYSWKWNDLAGTIGLSGNGVGHLAQQVREIHPELVTEASNGFLMINYSTPKTVSLN